MNSDLQFSEYLNIQSTSEGLGMTLEHYGKWKLNNICTFVYIVTEAAVSSPDRAADTGRNVCLELLPLETSNLVKLTTGILLVNHRLKV
jgi:hypothetical protein